MPYVLQDSNRYVGEHACGLYHYGNQSIVRNCCVEDCRKYAALTMKNAMTTSHPAYRLYVASYNELTEAEVKLVPNVSYQGLDRGFVVIPPQDSEAHLCC